MAEVQEPEFNAQTQRIDTVEERITTLEAMLSSFIITQTAGEDLTAENRVDDIYERQQLLETTLVEIRAQLQRLTGEAENLNPNEVASPLLNQGT